MAEEHVEFIANSKTTVYTGGSGVGYAPGSTVKLPKDHAEALDHLHARHETAPKPAPSVNDAAAKPTPKKSAAPSDPAQP